jgi:hypothetical protein
MKSATKTFFTCIAWLVILLPLAAFLTDGAIRVHLGVAFAANLIGTPADALYDELADDWYSAVLVGTFILVVAAAYSGLLWGARNRLPFVPLGELPASIRDDFGYAMVVACISASLTLGMALWILLGNFQSPALIHPADMLVAGVLGPALIGMSYRTKRLAPAVWLLLLYLSGQITTLLSGRVPSAGSLAMVVFYLSGYAKGILASWRYRQHQKTTTGGAPEITAD